MKYIDINQKFTAKVAEYIAKGIINFCGGICLCNGFNRRNPNTSEFFCAFGGSYLLGS